MQMISACAELLGGGLLLYLGAEWLVRGAAGLALALGLRPLIVGLTIVAYGTSAPELTVGVAASIDAHSAIVLGNSIGSNIANIGLILGLTVLIRPPRVDRGLMRREIPFLVISAVAVPVVLFDGIVSRTEGALLCLLFAAYTLWMLRREPRDGVATTRQVATNAERAGAPAAATRRRLAAITAVGLLLLIVGGKLFVDGAIAVARGAGVSERIVGLTIVAIGTSLPELATSLVAALRGHSSIAIGNLVGSNIFNILLLLGLAALIRPVPGSLPMMKPDLTVLLVSTAFTAITLRTERAMHRWEGAILIAIYVAFILWLAYP